MMNFNKRQAKSLTAAILLFVMLLTTCFTSFAAGKNVELLGDKEENSWFENNSKNLRYAESVGCSRPDWAEVPSYTVQGKQDGKYYGTIYDDAGFSYGTEPILSNVSILPSIEFKGNNALITYTVMNDSQDQVSFKFWIGADTTIAATDKSINVVNSDNTKLVMYGHTSNEEPSTIADCNISFVIASKTPGFYVIPTSYGDFYDFIEGDLTFDQMKTKVLTGLADSAFWACWEEKVLAAGEVATYTITAKIVGAQFVPVTGLTATEEYLDENGKLKTEYTVGDKFDIDAFIATPSNATNQDIEWDYDSIPEVDENDCLTKAGTYTMRGLIQEGKAEAGDDKDFRVEYTFTVKAKVATPSYVTEGGSEPRPTFTGNWDNPVTNGTWSQDANGAWYYRTNGSFRSTWGYIRNPYAKEGQPADSWFYFDATGKMVTGWYKINGSWFYFHETSDGILGAMQQGWVTWNGGQYYLTETKDSNGGKMLENTTTPDGHVVDASGKRIK